jgi:hypothetical protein
VSRQSRRLPTFELGVDILNPVNGRSHRVITMEPVTSCQRECTAHTEAEGCDLARAALATAQSSISPNVPIAEKSGGRVRINPGNPFTSAAATAQVQLVRGWPPPLGDIH